MRIMTWFATVLLTFAMLSPAQAGGEINESEGWAAIAFSTNPKKPDGWGGESVKDTQGGAIAAAIGWCERNLEDKGVRPAKCERVLAHQHWVVGIACHEPGRVWHGLGAGTTPAEAIQAALSELGDAPAMRCGTTVVRSGMHAWRKWYTTAWTIRLSCGRPVTSESELKGFTALTRAVLLCGRQKAGRIRVVEARHH